MQLKIFIDLKEKLILPVNYNHIIQGIIYHSINNKAYANKLHDFGIQNNNIVSNKFKFFSFSRIIGKYQILDNKIEFYNSIFFEIRSIDPYFIHMLYETFSKKGIDFGMQHFTPRLVLENNIITNSSIHIRTLSPILACIKTENKKTIFLSPNDNGFSEFIYDNFQNKYHSYYNSYPSSKIELVNDYISHKDKIVTTFKNIYLTAWNGIFYLDGSPEILTFLYNVGLGAKNSAGFGLFNILDD